MSVSRGATSSRSSALPTVRRSPSPRAEAQIPLTFRNDADRRSPSTSTSTATSSSSPTAPTATSARARQEPDRAHRGRDPQLGHLPAAHDGHHRGWPPDPDLRSHRAVVVRERRRACSSPSARSCSSRSGGVGTSADAVADAARRRERPRPRRERRPEVRRPAARRAAVRGDPVRRRRASTPDGSRSRRPAATTRSHATRAPSSRSAPRSRGSPASCASPRSRTRSASPRSQARTATRTRPRTSSTSCCSAACSPRRSCRSSSGTSSRTTTTRPPRCSPCRSSCSSRSRSSGSCSRRGSSTSTRCACTARTVRRPTGARHRPPPPVHAADALLRHRHARDRDAQRPATLRGCRVRTGAEQHRRHRGVPRAASRRRAARSPCDGVLDDDGLLLLMGLGTTAGIVVMALALLPALRRAHVHLRYLPAFRHPAVVTLVRVSGWTVGYVIANQIALFVVTVLANGTSGGPFVYVSAYAFFQLPHGLLAVSLATTFAPELARVAARRRPRRVARAALPRAPAHRGRHRARGRAVPRSRASDRRRAPPTRRVLRRRRGRRSPTRSPPSRSGCCRSPCTCSRCARSRRASTPVRRSSINCVENVVNIVLAFPLYAWLGIPGLALAFSLAYVVGVGARAVRAAARPPRDRRPRAGGHRREGGARGGGGGRRDLGDLPRHRLGRAPARRSSPTVARSGGRASRSTSGSWSLLRADELRILATLLPRPVPPHRV